MARESNPYGTSGSFCEMQIPKRSRATKHAEQTYGEPRHDELIRYRGVQRVQLLVQKRPAKPASRIGSGEPAAND